MFSKFDTQIQCEELTTYEPTQADWEEYHAWLEEQEAAEPEPEDFQLSAPEGWEDDADDSIGELDTIDDFYDIDDNELYNDPYNGEPFEDTYNDYDAWEAYCDYE